MGLRLGKLLGQRKKERKKALGCLNGLGTGSRHLFWLSEHLPTVSREMGPDGPLRFLIALFLLVYADDRAQLKGRHEFFPSPPGVKYL